MEYCSGTEKKSLVCIHVAGGDGTFYIINNHQPVTCPANSVWFKITLNDTEDIQRITKAISGKTSDIDFNKVINHNYGKEESKISIAAEINGRVAGFMISNILYAGFGLDRSAWIVTLGVDPDFMGQGIGKKMAEEIFEIYRKRGIKHIYSSVMWDSIDLLSFFKTLGFERSNFINLCKKI